MDYVRDFMEDVKHDRALQLKTFITVVLSITGFSLFCVEDARLHRANDVMHFTQVWDSKSEHKAMREERFPVISICPTTSDFEGQIKQLSCSGYGPNSFRSFNPVPQQISIGTISSATELFNCFTVNEKQDYIGLDSSFFIKCDITYNDLVNQGQARITTWANHDVWPEAIFQEPVSNTYKWKTVLQHRTSEFYMKVKKYDFKGKARWFADLNYGQYMMWNSTQDAGPHASFTLGHEFGGFEEHKQVKLYTTNMMLGTVGGMAFLLSCLNIVAFAFFAGLLQIDRSGSGGGYNSNGGANMYGSQDTAGGIPQSTAGGSYGSI